LEKFLESDLTSALVSGIILTRHQKKGVVGMLEKGWSLKKNEKGEGVFHNIAFGIRVPEKVYLKLKEEGKALGMKTSSFVKLILEIGLEAWEKQKETKIGAKQD
jgi:hypothetical protein